MSDDNEDDEIGYRRPPRATQFKKGTSGNPRGRPKRTRSFKADLMSELQETLILTENGKERRVSKQRAFIKTLTSAAIKKDIRAVNALLACIRYFGVDSEDQSASTVDTEDLEILGNFLSRETERKTSAEGPTATLKKRKAQ